MINRMYNFVRSRQLDGTFNDKGEIGTYSITPLRILKGWGNPPEATWPYNGNSEDWPPREEPKNIDEIAKKDRISVYNRVHSLAECKILLAQNIPVVFSLPINDKWFISKNGQIPTPESKSKSIGNHSMLLVGFDDTKSELKFLNSWGKNWGDKGYGYIPYDYYENFILDAWVILQTKELISSTSSTGVSIINYGIPNLLGEYIHVIEIVNQTKDDKIGWAFGVMRGKILEIEELFIHPNYRNKGYGSILSEEILKFSQEKGGSVRLLIPKSDCKNPHNLQILKKITSKMNLTLIESDRTLFIFEKIPFLF